ncbi:MAG: hypothetical protein MMC23_003335 [Stictis urceolatum]|nr:hypothetical protein [Stictis urceolata]
MSRASLLRRAEPSCPSGDGSTYTSPDGQEWVLYCDTGLSGNDLPSTSAASYADCIASCDTYTMDSSSAEGADGANCVAVTFASKNPNGNQCYLHFRVTEIRDEDSAWSARRKQYPVNGAAVYTEFENEQVKGATSSTSQETEAPKTTSVKKIELTPAPPTTQALKPSISSPPKVETSASASAQSAALSTRQPWPTPTSTSRPPPPPSATSKDFTSSSNSKPTSQRALFDRLSTSSSSLSPSPSPISSASSSSSSIPPHTKRPSPPTHPFSSSPTSPRASTATVTSLTTSTSISTPTPSSPGLSPAAKAGIAIGASLAILLFALLALGLVLLSRRRRSLGERLDDRVCGPGRMVREVNPCDPVEVYGDMRVMELGRDEKSGRGWGGGSEKGAAGGWFAEGTRCASKAWRGVHELAGSEAVAVELDGRKVGRKSWVRSWGSWGGWGRPRSGRKG